MTGAAKGSVRDAAEISDGASDEAWELEYLFDGACSICRNLKRSLEVADKAGRVHFVDISSLDYRPEEHMGIR